MLYSARLQGKVRYAKWHQDK